MLLFVLSLLAGCSTDQPEPAPPDLAQPDVPVEPGPEPSSTSLDAFLTGLETGCSGNPALTTALASMAEPVSGELPLVSSEIRVPEGLGELFGAPRITRTGEGFSIVSVDVSGATYLGFPVVSLSRTIGHGNGYSGIYVLLDAPMAQVQEVVGSKLKVTDSCEDDPGEGQEVCPVGPFKLMLVDKAPMTGVDCDTST